MKKFILMCTLVSTLLAIGVLPSSVISSPERSGYDVVAAVNGFRANLGLHTLQINGTLMAVAQAHSDYQAGIGSVTHIGPGGSRPKDRAAAAGYGGGASFFMSEIIYGGTGASVQTALNWWRNSPPHYEAMVSNVYTEAGAGVASAGGRNYYTMLLAHPTGGSFTPSSDDETGEVESLPAVMPVVVASPMANGSIVHVVQIGQTLWTIAAVYEVDLNDLLAINNLPPSAIIHPGDEILVKPGSSTTVSSTPSPSHTITHTVSVTPPHRGTAVGEVATPLPTNKVTRITIPLTTPRSSEAEPTGSSITSSTLVIIIASFVLIAGVIIVGFIKGGEGEQSDENSI